MSNPLHLILLVLAFVCFVISIFSPVEPNRRSQLVSAGLAFWVAASIF